MLSISGFLATWAALFRSQPAAVDAAVIKAAGLRNLLELTTAKSVPVGLPVSGSTIGANGTLTLASALPLTFADGPLGIWMFFPAGAVVGGPAGFYWTVMTSATVGQVYTNYVDPTLQTTWPAEPTGGLTLAVGSGAAFTQSTSNLRCGQFVLPGGTLLKGDVLRWSISVVSSGAGTKSYTPRINGVQMGTSAPFHSTVQAMENDMFLRALTPGALSALVWGTTTAHNVNLAAPQTLSLDFRGSAGNENIILWQRATIEKATL